MVWALLAAFLTRRPPWVQAGMVRLCTGLFVVANVNAGQRDLRVGSATVLVPALVGIRALPGRRADSDHAVPPGPL
jgi:hypothetical protein